MNRVFLGGSVLLSFAELLSFGQQPDFRDRDPRLRAAAFFALFSGGQILSVDRDRTRAEFSRGSAGKKAWTCDDIVRRQGGEQKSRCYLTEDRAATALTYQATVSISLAGTSVVLESQIDQLFYGDKLPDAAFVPTWVPKLPSDKLADGWIALSRDRETIDLTFRLPKNRCVSHFRSVSPTGEMGSLGKDDAHWTIIEGDRIVQVDVEAIGSDLCHLKGSRTPKKP